MMLPGPVQPMQQGLGTLTQGLLGKSLLIVAKRDLGLRFLHKIVGRSFRDIFQ